MNCKYISLRNILKKISVLPDIYLFKVNTENTRTILKTCSKLAHCYNVSVVDFEQVNAGLDISNWSFQSVHIKLLSKKNNPRSSCDRRKIILLYKWSKGMTVKEAVFAL